MTIPSVGQLTAFAFVAAVDDPSRIRRSRDIGAYFGLVPKRYQSGNVDYVGSISKCGDRRVRTPVRSRKRHAIRYKGQLKLKDWAFAIAKRSTMRKRGLRRLAASRSSCTRCCETERSSHRPKPRNPRDWRPNLAPKRERRTSGSNLTLDGRAGRRR
jgi:transposase